MNEKRKKQDKKLVTLTHEGFRYLIQLLGLEGAQGEDRGVEKGRHIFFRILFFLKKAFCFCLAGEKLPH